MDEGERVACRVRVTGRVQGVAFRMACRRAATEHGVTGWVRNEPDGSVTAHAEGTSAAVGRLVEWCHQGPPGSRVETVEVAETAPEEPAGFEIRS